MEFSRQEYWSGLSFPSPGDLPNLGIKPGFPALQADSLPSEPQGSHPVYRVIEGVSNLCLVSTPQVLATVINTLIFLLESPIDFSIYRPQIPKHPWLTFLAAPTHSHAHSLLCSSYTLDM